MKRPTIMNIPVANGLQWLERMDRHRKDLSYQNWNLVIQQQLPAKLVVQLGYVGKRSIMCVDCRLKVTIGGNSLKDVLTPNATMRSSSEQAAIPEGGPVRRWASS